MAQVSNMQTQGLCSLITDLLLQSLLQLLRSFSLTSLSGLRGSKFHTGLWKQLRVFVFRYSLSNTFPRWFPHRATPGMCRSKQHVVTTNGKIDTHVLPCTPNRCSRKHYPYPQMSVNRTRQAMHV